MSIAEVLRKARESRGLSIRNLAKLSGVSPASISRLECGWQNVTLDVMRALTEALQLDIRIWFELPASANLVNFSARSRPADHIVVGSRGAA